MTTSPVLEMVGTFALLGALVKGGLVVACAALVTVPLRRASAATRQAVWAGTFVALALLPFSAWLLPQWSVELPVAFPDRVVASLGAMSSGPVQRVMREPSASARDRGAVTPGAQTGARAGDGPAGRASRFPTGRLPSPLAVFGLLYAVGCGALLVRLVVHTHRATRMARRGTRPAGALARRVESVRRDGLLPERVRVLLHEDADGPLTFGLLQPVVILPLNVRTWPEDRLRVALLHECAHVQRGDALMHLLVRLVAAFYWPNPFVRMACARQRAEQERACDDRAIRAGIASHDYAHHLVRVAREGMARRTVAATAASLSIAGGGLRERVAAIMDGATDRRPMSRPRVGLAMLALLALVLPGAALELRGAGTVPDGPVSFPVGQTQDRTDPLERARAAWRLGELQRPEGVTPLLQHLRDDDATLRAVAAWALAEIKDDRAVPALEGVLANDPDPAVRELAALALGEIGADAGVPALTIAVQSDMPVQPAAAWALRRIGGLRAVATDGISPWLDLDGVAPPFRTAAPLAADAARRALGSADAAERALGAWSFGVAADAAAVDVLIEHIRDTDPTVRAAVVWALDEINPSRS